jgi:hypothetical protein
MIGLQDDQLADRTVNPGPRMARIDGLNARVARVDLRWDLVAARRPARPTSPADPAYDWSHYDRVVDAARARGVRLLFSVWGTPGWAAYPAFSTRPERARDAGNFARAAAARYAPRGVTMWEAWNEPNIPLFLRPQYRRAGRSWVADSPRVYAGIAREMYRGIKAVAPRARVAGGVTAPAGDARPQQCAQQPDCRVTPQAFATALGRRGLRPPMDVYSHHPYPITTPRSRNNPRASYVDLYNLGALTRVLDRGYLRGKRLWLTEFGFGTRAVPNYRLAVTPARQSAYLTDAVRRVRANPRVGMFIWYFLQDNPNWASGLYERNGRAKPAAATFRRLTA